MKLMTLKLLGGSSATWTLSKALRGHICFCKFSKVRYFSLNQLRPLSLYILTFLSIHSHTFHNCGFAVISMRTNASYAGVEMTSRPTLMATCAFCPLSLHKGGGAGDILKWEHVIRSQCWEYIISGREGSMKPMKPEANLKNILVIGGVNFQFLINDSLFIDASSRQTFFPDRNIMQPVRL